MPSSSPVAPHPRLFFFFGSTLDVTSTGGERLHAGWLPPGDTTTEGKPVISPRSQSITYSGPAMRIVWRVTLIRYRSTAPLSDFIMGRPTQNITVQGHAGILTDHH